ncbi:hypothetical protein BKA69DRAFT_337542 [Paraphysoderma sedebokerense]|nr:hypothetical protein BKA69DRAFT_337542 [Paraphysoderma sedebokerense]
MKSIQRATFEKSDSTDSLTSVQFLDSLKKSETGQIVIPATKKELQPKNCQSKRLKIGLVALMVLLATAIGLGVFFCIQSYSARTALANEKTAQVKEDSIKERNWDHLIGKIYLNDTFVSEARSGDSITVSTVNATHFSNSAVPNFKRVVYWGTPVTMDYSPTRLNLYLNQSEHLEKWNYG